MLEALIHNKLSRSIHQGRFKAIEDTLTSSVIGLLQYLPDDLFWQIISKSCGNSSVNLPNIVGKIESINFWEKLNATDTYNTLYVETNVWIITEKYNIIIEAKKSDNTSENYQYEEQWLNEITAVGHVNKRPILFIAIGGNNNLKDKTIKCKKKNYTIHTASWYNLMNAIIEIRNEILSIKDNNRIIVSILEKAIKALEFHHIIKTIWFDTLYRTSINLETASNFNKNNIFSCNLLGELIKRKEQIKLISLDKIWKAIK